MRRKRLRTKGNEMNPAIHADVVIIGSGAGGGTVAAALAPLVAQGKRVLVLEKGARIDPKQLTGAEVASASLLYGHGGAHPTADHTVTLAYGEALGGSTMVYTGTSMTPPERVISGWNLPGLSYDDVVERTARYAVQNNASFIPDNLINDNNRLFQQGCEALGRDARQFPINVRGCRGSSLCNLGCPNNAKQGTAQVQIPAAQAAGVEVVTRAEVRGLRVGGRGGILDVFVDDSPHPHGSQSEWAPGHHVVHASSVVVAAGAIHSPALLLRSGLTGDLPAIGRFWTCHPAHILAGEHDHVISNYVGHPKSFVWEERVEAERYFLESCMYFPFITAKNLTGFGADHERLMAAYERLQMILVLACDDALPDQRVAIDVNGNPVIHYKLMPKTIEAMVRGTRAAAEIFFAAGAHAVHAPSARPTLIERSENADLNTRITTAQFLPGTISVSAAHLMGGCRMGATPRDSVTTSRGQVHGHDWLFVADASLFPTALEINPYLTIMAVADHVAEAVADREGQTVPRGGQAVPAVA